jgi:anti-anti-sigma factor
MNNQFIPAAQMLHIAIPGDLLSTNADQFRASARAVIESSVTGNGCLGVELDLTRARMVDSAGLNAIIGVIRSLSAHGKKTLIRVGDPHVHRVCLFTRLDRIAEIVRN